MKPLTLSENTTQQNSVTSPSTKPTFDKTRALSWSAISSFEYDPEQWYKKYVMKEEQPTTKEMEFGKLIGECLASDPHFMPEVVRYKVFEHELRCMVEFKKEKLKIPLVGYMDTSHIEEKKMREYKSGKKPWTQARTDGKDASKWGQLDMYLLMIYEIYKIRPEEMTCHVDWMQTVDIEPTHDSLEDFLKNKSTTTVGLVDGMQVKSFETRRSMADILRFRTRILKTFQAMEKYALDHE